MNFILKTTSITVQNKGSLKQASMLCLGALLAALLSACTQVKNQDTNGDITVQIPTAQVTNGEASYQLKPVVLKDVYSVRQLNGKYAKFFLSPGNSDDQIQGFSPFSYFIKLANGLFTARDENSLEMATLYYHMQNLIQFCDKIHFTREAAGPFQVGLQTKIRDIAELESNNAFYDGKTNAMYFVPYTLNGLPISVNGGIIAHEFFHSIFYQLVFAKQSRQETSDHQAISKNTVHIYERIVKDTALFVNTDLKAQTAEELFNETYLRGINEGLADFWGWIYTTDPEFIKWSLPGFSEKRNLNQVGVVNYISKSDILDKVNTALDLQNSESVDPSELLTGIIYKIGTPYGRYLKSLVEVTAQTESLTLDQAKIKIAQQVLDFLQQTSQDFSQLKKSEVLPVENLFLYFSVNSKSQISKEQCELSINYLNSTDSTNPAFKCQQNQDKSFKATKI